MLQRWLDSLRHRRRSHLLGAVSAIFYFVGFVGLEQYYLSWICLVPVLWALDDDSLTGREMLALAWIFGTITHMGGYTWIIGMLRKFAYLPLPLAFLGYFLLCVAQGSLLAAWAWSVHRLAMRFKVPIVWGAPVLMVVMEWLYPALFPSYLSNSQYRQTTFIQSLDLWGPLGLTFILTLTSSTLYAVLAHFFRGGNTSVRSLPKAALVAWLVLVAGNTVYGIAAITNIDDTVAETDKRLRIGLVQTNMGIYEKTKNPQEGHRRHIEQSLEMVRQGADLIVWPESGYYYPIREGTKNVKQSVMGDLDVPLVFGALRTTRPTADNKRRGMYNTAFLVDGKGDIQGTYDKTFLLAFGEYIPLGDLLPFIYDLSPHTSHFDRGEHTDPLMLDDIALGMLICYEDILPGFVREVMRQEPDILVNITNDAWFGKTREPLIHLALAAFRAVEHRRFLVRATNTGISAFVDPAGRIVDATPVFARSNLIASVAPLQGRTVYGLLGDWLGWLCLLVCVWWLRALPLRRRSTGS